MTINHCPASGTPTKTIRLTIKVRGANAQPMNVAFIPAMLKVRGLKQITDTTILPRDMVQVSIWHSDYALGTLINWYNEADRLPPDGRGFLTGTLLLYTIHDLPLGSSHSHAPHN